MLIVAKIHQQMNRFEEVLEVREIIFDPSAVDTRHDWLRDWKNMV